MNKYGALLLAVCGVSLSALAALKNDSQSIALRFVPANDAYTALKEHLGGDAASVITNLDIRRNALDLDQNHPQAAKAREFLTAFDVRPAQVIVHAVISRRVAATPNQEAHDKILSRPTAVVREGDPVVFNVPGEGGETKIELRINSLPAQKR